MEHGKFNAMVDSAWGSSGKGAASTRLADIYNTKNVSSCNYPNAGHTVIVNKDKYVFKVLPSAMALNRSLHKNFVGWIGPNSGFTNEQLAKELGLVDARANLNLFIHERAVVVTDEHIQAEAKGGSKSTLHISSTMSGSGAAATDKAMRLPSVITAAKIGIGTENWEFFNKVQEELEKGHTFLHEVSQGFALSVNHGTHYPYCTFRDCTPQQAFADFCINKNQIGDIYLNVRSLPIRVGNNYENGQQVGYSGDTLGDSQELSWAEVAENAEMPKDVADALAERERTTVTKKVRRVFTPSWLLLKQSARMCGATKLVLNFPQYIHWSAHKVRGGEQQFKEMHPKVREYVDKMEEVTGLPVVLIGTGEDHYDYVFRG